MNKHVKRSLANILRLQISPNVLRLLWLLRQCDRPVLQQLVMLVRQEGHHHLISSDAKEKLILLPSAAIAISG